MDEEASDAPVTVIARMEAEYLREAIGHLSERARYVLLRRYGLDGQAPATLLELVTEHDISRERVRQMQREAEQTIRRGAYGPLLRGVVA